MTAPESTICHMNRHTNEISQKGSENMGEVDLCPRSTRCLTARNHHHLTYPSRPSPLPTHSPIPSNILQCQAVLPLSLSPPPQFSKINPRACSTTAATSQDSLSKSTVDPCGFCSLRVKANSVLCGRWIHGRCDGVKKLTPKFSRNFACRKCERNIGEAVGQEVK